MRRFLFALAGLLIFAQQPARAQFIGYTSPQTVTQPAFTSANCSSTIKSANMPNVGQSVHIVTYSIPSFLSSQTPTVRIEGSTDGTNFFQISDDGLGNPNALTGALVGYGAYPFIQVWVLGGGAGCLATATYTGTSVSPPTSVGNMDATAYQKLIWNQASDGSNQSLNNLTTPYGNSGGMIIWTSVAGQPPPGSSLVVTSTTTTGNIAQIATFPLAIQSATPQTFVVPSVPAQSVNISYSSGGSSTNLMNVIYIFAKPGVAVVPQGENKVILNTAAAGPTRIIQGSLGGSVRIVSISVGSGTAEQVDFQQGTGTNCGGTNSQLTGLIFVPANQSVSLAFPGGGLVALPGYDVCIHLSAANQTNGTITMSQY